MQQSGVLRVSIIHSDLVVIIRWTTALSSASSLDSSELENGAKYRATLLYYIFLLEQEKENVMEVLQTLTFDAVSNE